MSELRRQLIANASQGTLPPYVGEPFLDTNGFHLSAPYWMSDGETMPWVAGYGQDKIVTSYWDKTKHVARNGHVDISGTANDTDKYNMRNSGRWTDYGWNNPAVPNQKKIYVINDPFGISSASGTPGVNTYYNTAVFTPYFYVIEGKNYDGMYIDLLLFNIQEMGIKDFINTADDFLVAFGYTSWKEVPRFTEDMNGILVAYKGKLYRKL